MDSYLAHRPEIYPKAHENPRIFSCISGPIFLEFSIQCPWGVGLHQEVLISNHTMHTRIWKAHNTLAERFDLLKYHLMWHPLSRYTYLYNKIHRNAELHNMILFNKHRGPHVGKMFTFAFITKLNLSIKGMKMFLTQNKVIQNSREWTKDLACETKW